MPRDFVDGPFLWKNEERRRPDRGGVRIAVLSIDSESCDRDDKYLFPLVRKDLGSGMYSTSLLPSRPGKGSLKLYLIIQGANDVQGLTKGKEINCSFV
ncbi:hypothetical protein AVEN_262023-1 [Araneus ventricosus]|uniref:Uncharacterized protein n=1 Tax=Araneus ventricosus TaxID=182803 RepID=A0A4Y2TME0_ARAVE|nr:hypothetical protein AVEN_262023-1 [Araneus ventricosus]